MPRANRLRDGWHDRVREYVPRQLTDEARAAHTPPVRGGRIVAAQVLAGVAAVFWGWLFFGVQDTLTVFVGGQEFAKHYLMESGWGLLFLVLVATPLVGLARRPRTVILVAQVGTVGLALAVGALLARSASHLLPAAGVLLTASAVAVLAGLDKHPGRARVDAPLAVLAVIAAVPAIGYAWRMAHSHVDVEQTVNLDHYPVQAALSVAVVLLAGLIALTKEWPGTRLVAAALTVTVGWMGIESAVYPHKLGSFGTAWGWLAVVWSIALLGAAIRPGP